MTNFRRLIYFLKRECPCAYPVTVRRVRMADGDDGDCSKHKNKFYIRINRKIVDEHRAIDALLHEWAHARAWNHLHDSMDANEFSEKVHDAAWGVAYSEVYCIFEQKFCIE